MIEDLPRLAPDTARARRTVARCHQRMARNRKRLAASANPHARTAAIERALVGGLGLIYVSSVMLIAVQVFSAR